MDLKNPAVASKRFASREIHVTHFNVTDVIPPVDNMENHIDLS